MPGTVSLKMITIHFKRPVKQRRRRKRGKNEEGERRKWKDIYKTNETIYIRVHSSHPITINIL